ncbi:MAG: RsmG family class I SAM-dependent methyltransferase, partial [Pseudomonadota bacterium]
MPMDLDGFGREDICEQIDVSRETFERLDRVITCLDVWRKTMNLIGPSEWDHIWRRHIWDSLQIWPLLPPNARIIDL